MTTSPHDRLFKAVFSSPENATACFEACLPREILAALDLERAELVPGSWVDEDLREHLSDLLFRVPQRGASEHRTALLYVLFEHQSTVEGQMALKALRYLTRVLDRWSREHPGEKLPPVLPLVLYHGDQEWTAPLDLEGLYDLDGLDRAAADALRPYRPGLRYLLEVVTATPDEQIPGRGIARLTLLALKHGRGEELRSAIFEWQEDFRHEVGRGAPGLNNITLIVEYLLVVSETVTAADIAEALRPMGNEARDIPMTTGQKLIEQGREEGVKEERRRVALRLLAEGTPPARVAELTELPLDEVLELTH